MGSWHRRLRVGLYASRLTDPNIIWASCYGKRVTRFDQRTKRARSVSPWIHTLDSEPNKSSTAAIGRRRSRSIRSITTRVYYGCQVIFKTSNGGQSWSVISPDLSTNDPSRIVCSGGIIEDNLGQFYGEVVFAIAPSEIQSGLIWAGERRPAVEHEGRRRELDERHEEHDGLPTWGTIRKIEPSHFDPATAYVAVDLHMMDDRKPTSTRPPTSATWTNITGDLPATHPLDYVMSVAENPNRKGMLFAGTGHDFFYSLDDGTHWRSSTKGCRTRGVVDLVPQALARRHRVDVRPRHLHSARHRAARAASAKSPTRT